VSTGGEDRNNVVRGDAEHPSPPASVGTPLNGVSAPAAGRMGDKAIEGQPTSPQAKVGPSYDCALAKTPTERQICGDSDLASLEREMVNAYKQTLMRLPGEQQVTFRREHSIWFKEYARTCDAISMDGPRKDCITGYLSSHTRQLERYTGR
jgi:uncharacterized protein YecT (DUF1311 family)